MSHISIGLPIHFGLGFPADQLPEGWKLEESEDDFARAIDPAGRRYLVTTDGTAYPEIIEGENAITLDSDNPISFKD